MPGAIRMGCIGAGHVFSDVHLPIMSRMSDVELLALCDIRQAALAAALKRFGFHETTTRYQDLLKMQELDAVLITLPNYLHAKVAERALRAGKHVLCEKPAAIHRAEIEAVKRAADETGLVYMVAMPHRFDAQAVYLKRLITAGHLGRIQYVRAGIMRHDGCPGGWFTDRDHSGGGAFMHLGGHLLDLILWLMDFPTVTTVSAACHQKVRLSGAVTRAEIHDVEDSASVMIRTAEAQAVMLEVSWNTHYGANRDYLELCGERGSASLWPLRVYQELEGSGVEIVPQPPAVDAYQALQRHFLDCIRARDKKLQCAAVGNADDGVRLVSLVESIYESAAAHREVSVSGVTSTHFEKRGIM